MYVLMDMEWIRNWRGNCWPTQLAAMRVDKDWNTMDSFSALIQPKDTSFRDFGHVAFSGWRSADFLKGMRWEDALLSFQKWLLPDDILCWWHQQPSERYYAFQKATSKKVSFARPIILNKYVFGFLLQSGISCKNLYKLCAAQGISVYGTEHCAQNDVVTIQLLLKGIGFPQERLLTPPDDWAGDSAALKGSSEFPLLYDPSTGLLHTSTCQFLTNQQYLPAYRSFLIPIRRKYQACSCCKKSYYDALYEKNQLCISNSNYDYVYSTRSKIFHTKTCSHILYAHSIQGAVFYDTCIKSGRRPCKHCKPTPKTVSKPAISINQKPTKNAAASHLNKDEKSALGRYHRARNERQCILNKDNLTENQRSKTMALAQPGLAFWAGRGCRTFHRRNCSKLSGLSQLKGFSKYQDALRAGYTPCRHCKPNPSQNAVYSIPITNRVRNSENHDTLIGLCTNHCLPFQCNDRYFFLQTPVGKWKIDIHHRPVRLEHINLVRAPHTQTYHVQPRLFLSLTDTFDYIIRHDGKLMCELHKSL